MGQSAQQVRADIERTREDLGQDLDAIGDKISPRQAVRRRTDRVRGTLTDMKERIMGSAESATTTVTSEGSSVADRFVMRRRTSLRRWVTPPRVRPTLFGAPLMSSRSRPRAIHWPWA